MAATNLPVSPSPGFPQIHVPLIDRCQVPMHGWGSRDTFPCSKEGVVFDLATELECCLEHFLEMHRYDSQLIPAKKENSSCHSVPQSKKSAS